MKRAGRKAMIASWILYWLIGGFFLFAALVKIAHPEAFFSSLLTYELFPHKLAVALAFFAPMLELLLGVCLITGILRQGAVWLTGLMLLVFIAVIVQGRLRGLSIDCGCFGSNRLESDFEYVWKLGQNTLLLLGLWGAVLLERASASAGRKKDANL